jgi:hypothetical protein
VILHEGNRSEPGALISVGPGLCRILQHLAFPERAYGVLRRTEPSHSQLRECVWPSSKELTSCTPETRRSFSVRESRSPSSLPFPRSSSALSHFGVGPGRTTMRSNCKLVASISDLKSPREVFWSMTRVMNLGLQCGNSRVFTDLASTRISRDKTVAATLVKNMPPLTARPTTATAQTLEAVVKP